MNDAWIESDSLSKKFSESYAINDVSFKLVENSSSLIGPNRAGKSTLIGMMEGLIHPTNGYIRVLNRYPEESALEIRKKIGFTPERPSFYVVKTVEEALQKIINLKHSTVQEIKELIDVFDFGKYLNRRISSLSLGEQQILSVITAISWGKEAVILDEPNANLDIWRRSEFLNVLERELRSRGLKYLISTHLLDKTLPFTERTILLNRGKIVFDGKTEYLITKFTDDYIFLTSNQINEIAFILNKLGFDPQKISNFTLKVKIETPISDLLRDIPDKLQKSILRIERTPLEDIIRQLIESSCGDDLY